ncbi:MAG: hypothetical protein ACLR0U_30970 [Enterocloster clostridioformis]
MLVVTAVIGITFCAVTSVVKHRVNDQGAWPCPGGGRGGAVPDICRHVSGQDSVLHCSGGEDGAVTLGKDTMLIWEPEYLKQMAVLGMTGEEDMGILDAYHLEIFKDQPARRSYDCICRYHL